LTVSARALEVAIRNFERLAPPAGDRIEHRALTRYGHDMRVSILSFRAWAVWCLGYPDAALMDAHHALQDAREIGQAATLMVALSVGAWTQQFCGDYVAASSVADELIALATDKGAAWFKAVGTMEKGQVFALTGKASLAVQTIIPALTALRSTGGTTYIPWNLSHLARAYADLRQFDEAWRSIVEALTAAKTTKEKMALAEFNRMAGEIALKSPDHDTAKAEVYFQRALTVARQQQAKSWELRAAMSLARLWRDQGKVQQARELLAPVYGWFTEGFDTRDLKDGKALLEELAS
jgi:predicted ATPase